jgi:hypothetical protein
LSIIAELVASETGTGRNESSTSQYTVSIQRSRLESRPVSTVRNQRRSTAHQNLPDD